MEDMRLILGNAYEEIKKLPDKSVDLIISTLFLANMKRIIKLKQEKSKE